MDYVNFPHLRSLDMSSIVSDCGYSVVTFATNIADYFDALHLTGGTLGLERRPKNYFYARGAGLAHIPIFGLPAQRELCDISGIYYIVLFIICAQLGHKTFTGCILYRICAYFS